MTAQLKVSSPTDARLPQPGEVVAGKYRVDGFIARGGMGAVLAATHVVTGRRLALKWVLPDAEQDAEATLRVLREARAAARVRHPNVVDVYDVGEHDGSLFLVMELLEGETLHARLKAEGALDPRTTLTLLMPALRAVEAAHASHVIHRDLKPSNIFLCRDSAHADVTPRVLDFGISKIVAASGDGERSLTRTGAVLGTPHYMAPEQLTGDDADARADIYALGVILYQCLTGRLPFHDDNYNALVLQIATATPVPVVEVAPHVPKGLSAVVMRAIARDASARFPSVAALTSALLPFAEPSRTGDGPTGAARRSRLWLVTLAVCVVTAIAAWAGLRRARETEPSPPTADSAPTQLPRAANPSEVAPIAPVPIAPAAPTVAQTVAPVTPPESTRASDPELESDPGSRRGRARARSTKPTPEASPRSVNPTLPADTAPSRKTPVPISLEQF